MRWSRWSSKMLMDMTDFLIFSRTRKHHSVKATRCLKRLSSLPLRAKKLNLTEITFQIITFSERRENVINYGEKATN